MRKGTGQQVCVLRQTGEPRPSQTYFTRRSMVPLKAGAGPLFFGDSERYLGAGGVRSCTSVVKSKNLIEWKSSDPQTGVELYCFGRNVIGEAR